MSCGYNYNEKNGAYVSKSLFGTNKRDANLSINEINKLHKTMNMTTLTKSDIGMLHNLAKELGYKGDDFINEKLSKIYEMIPNNKISIRNLIRMAVKYRDSGKIMYDDLPKIEPMSISNREILITLCLFNIVFIIVLILIIKSRI